MKQSVVYRLLAYIAIGIGSTQSFFIYDCALIVLCIRNLESHLTENKESFEKF